MDVRASPLDGFKYTHQMLNERWEYMVALLPMDGYTDMVNNVSIMSTAIPLEERKYVEIVRFSAKEAMEETILRWMHRAFLAQPCICIADAQTEGQLTDDVYAVMYERVVASIVGCLKPVEQYLLSNDCSPLYASYDAGKYLQDRKPATTLPLSSNSPRTSQHPEISQLYLLRRQTQFDRFRQLSIFHLAK